MNGVKVKRIILIFMILGFMISCGQGEAGGKSRAYKELPVKGMVTMIDLGADKCVPCKMMAPILKEVEKEYKNKAAIVFLDVWKDPAPARRFGIRAIPTQIFFDRNGREVFRHVGFLDKKSIVTKLAELGVK